MFGLLVQEPDLTVSAVAERLNLFARGQPILARFGSADC